MRRFKIGGILLIFFAFAVPFPISYDRGLHAQPIANDSAGLYIVYLKSSLQDIRSQDVEVAIPLLMNQIAANYNESVVVEISDDLRSSIAKFHRGEIDMLVATALDFIQNVRHYDPDHGYAIGAHGHPKQIHLLIANKDSAIKSTEDAYQQILVTHRNNYVGRLFLDTWLLKRGKAPSEHYFSETLTLRSKIEVINKVFFRKAAIALTTDAAFELAQELNPQVGKRLTVLARSSQLLQRVGFLRENFNGDKARLLDDVITGLHESSKGKQMLMLFRGEQMFRVTKDDLTSLKKLIEEYKTLKSLSYSQ